MKRIVLDCRGRLANQLLCWANARHVLSELGLTDRIIVINYSIPKDCITFPGAIVAAVDTSNLPKVKRDGLVAHEDDCLWPWEDVYSRFPGGGEINRIIRTIELTPNFARSLKLTMGVAHWIGIHARFGDYVKVDSEKPPANLSPFIRGSDAYFSNAVALCHAAMPDARFYLASDGTEDELRFLTRNPDVVRGKPNEPVFDLFALAQCRFIIGSGSTFSSCAAAYGQIPLILPTTTESEIRSVIEGHK